MSIATPSPNNSYYHRRKRWAEKKRSFIGIPKETSYQERRICPPDAVNSLSSMGIG
jgi:hypothetical protein